MGLKVSDFAAVPLCRAHHAEYHDGALTFEERYAIDLVEAASVYAFRSPHRIARDLRRQQEARA